MKSDKAKSQLLDLLLEDAQHVISSLDLSGFANKDVMVTGAGGLIGIHVLLTLIKLTSTVPGINIIPVIHSDISFLPESYFHLNSVKFFKGDLTDEEFCKSLPEADIIIHGAGSGEPSKFISDPLPSLKINTLTTLLLAEKLRKSGRFLFISSSDIYNGLPSGKYNETQIGITNTDHPRACYIEGKRTGETICNLLRGRGVNAIAVRLSLTYGPGMRIGDQRVLPSFVQKGLKGPINLLDPGNGVRTFCYISDAIEMMLFIILHGKERLYNVGGITSCKVSELATLVGRLCNVPVIIPQADQSIAGAPENVLIDITRLLTEYRKRDFIGLEEGLKRTINWYNAIV